MRRIDGAEADVVAWAERKQALLLIRSRPKLRLGTQKSVIGHDHAGAAIRCDTRAQAAASAETGSGDFAERLWSAHEWATCFRNAPRPCWPEIRPLSQMTSPRESVIAGQAPTSCPS